MRDGASNLGTTKSQLYPLRFSHPASSSHALPFALQLHFASEKILVDFAILLCEQSYLVAEAEDVFWLTKRKKKHYYSWRPYS